MKTLIQLYYSFVYPYLLYGNIIWGTALKTYLERIEKLQKMAIRLIFNTRRREHTTPIFKREHIIKVRDLNEYVTTIFMHKLVHGKLPPYFGKMFISNASIHDKNTRQTNQFHVPLFKTQVGNSFVTKIGTRIWNEIVLEKNQYLSLGQIKNMKKVEILSRY